MSKESAISNMQTAILKYIDSMLPRDINKAKVGIVDGNKVHLTNGRTYSFDPVVDTYFSSGSKVACLVPDGSNNVAVVGVY